jgi:CheY-like chemotaxis protein
MPEKDGLEVLMEFRRNFPDKKIIAISGGARNISPEDSLQMAEAFGAKYSFKKPVDREALLDAIKELLE